MHYSLPKGCNSCLLSFTKTFFINAENSSASLLWLFYHRGSAKTITGSRDSHCKYPLGQAPCTQIPGTLFRSLMGSPEGPPATVQHTLLFQRFEKDPFQKARLKAQISSSFQKEASKAISLTGTWTYRNFAHASNEMRLGKSAHH